MFERRVLHKLDIPIQQNVDRHLRLISNTQGDVKHFGLISQIEEYIFEQQQNTSIANNTGKLPTERYIDSVWAFLQDNKTKLDEDQITWLHEKMRILMVLARVEEKYSLLQMIRENYWNETSSRRTQDEADAATVEREGQQEIERVKSWWQVMENVIVNAAKEKYGVGAPEIEGLLMHEDRVPVRELRTPDFLKFLEKSRKRYKRMYVDKIDRINRIIDETIQEIADSSPVDYRYLYRLKTELDSLEELGGNIAWASVGMKNRNIDEKRLDVRKKADQVELEDESQLGKQSWTYSAGSYNERFGLIGLGQKAEEVLFRRTKPESGEYLADIHDFVINRIRQLLAESDKRPVVLVDIGGMYGFSMLQMAEVLEKEIRAGELVIIVTNYEVTAEQIAKIAAYNPKLGYIGDEIAKLMSRGLVQYHRADAGEMGDITIQTPNGLKKLSEIKADIMLESFSLTIHSEKMDDDIKAVTKLISDNGIFVSQDNGQASGPLSHEAIERASKRPGDTEKQQFEVQDHPYLPLTKPDTDDVQNVVLTLTNKLYHNMNAAVVEFIAEDFVEIREVPVKKNQAAVDSAAPTMEVTAELLDAELKLATPIIWAKRGALPLRINDEDGKLVAEVPTNRSWAEQLNEAGNPKTKLGKIWSLLRRNF